MAHESKSQGAGALRGFASMEQGKQREIARKGGANVPHEKRSFAQDRTLFAGTFGGTRKRYVLLPWSGAPAASFVVPT